GEQHDAFGLRYSLKGDRWVQRHSDQPHPIALTRIDLTGCGDGWVDALERRAQAIHASLDLEAGPVVLAAWFDLGAAQASRLFIVAHHLVVDGVSWRIMLEDLARAYQDSGPGLPPKTTSFKDWAERLVGYAESAALASSLAWWEGLAWAR